MKNINEQRTLFYWLLMNFNNPMQITVIWKNHATMTALSRILFKVYKKDKKLMYSTIYEKSAHNGEFKLYVRKPIKTVRKAKKKEEDN